MNTWILYFNLKILIHVKINNNLIPINVWLQVIFVTNVNKYDTLYQSLLSASKYSLILFHFITFIRDVSIIIYHSFIISARQNHDVISLNDN